jgi:hypothetical protein
MTVDYDNAFIVSATVMTDNQEHVTRAAETFARFCAGLLLEGITVSLTMGKVDSEEIE